MDKIKKSIMALLPFLLMPSVNALDLTDAVGPISQVGQFLQGLLSSTSARFAVIFFLCFMLFYSIFATALTFLPLFNNQDKQRKVLAIAFSFLSTIGLYMYANWSPQTFTERILTPMGPFGAVILSVVMFLLIYYTFRDSDNLPNAPMALMGAGFALVVSGTLLGQDSLVNIGFLLFIIGLIWFIIALARGGHRPEGDDDEGGRGGRDEEDMGPQGRRYHRPNRVPNINIYTVPEDEEGDGE